MSRYLCPWCQDSGDDHESMLNDDNAPCRVCRADEALGEHAYDRHGVTQSRLEELAEEYHRNVLNQP